MSKFMKNDHVRNLNGIEGIVTEVFISYPTLCGLADWSAPQVHYLVSFGENKSKLYVDGDLTDIRQGELDLWPTITDWGIAASEEDYWSKWYV
jgi:hypothetical protein